MTGDLVAQLKGASFSYYGAPETLHAVDLDVHAGECVVLMGASGSGKTTIVRVLNGLAGGYYAAAFPATCSWAGFLRAIWRRGEEPSWWEACFKTRPPSSSPVSWRARWRSGARTSAIPPRRW